MSKHKKLLILIDTLTIFYHVLLVIYDPLGKTFYILLTTIVLVYLICRCLGHLKSHPSKRNCLEKAAVFTSFISLIINGIIGGFSFLMMYAIYSGDYVP